MVVLDAEPHELHRLEAQDLILELQRTVRHSQPGVDEGRLAVMPRPLPV